MHSKQPGINSNHPENHTRSPPPPPLPGIQTPSPAGRCLNARVSIRPQSMRTSRGGGKGSGARLCYSLPLLPSFSILHKFSILDTVSEY